MKASAVSLAQPEMWIGKPKTGLFFHQADFNGPAVGRAFVLMAEIDTSSGKAVPGGIESVGLLQRSALGNGSGTSKGLYEVELTDQTAAHIQACIRLEESLKMQILGDQIIGEIYSAHLTDEDEEASRNVDGCLHQVTRQIFRLARKGEIFNLSFPDWIPEELVLHIKEQVDDLVSSVWPKTFIAPPVLIDICSKQCGGSGMAVFHYGQGRIEVGTRGETEISLQIMAALFAGLRSIPNFNKEDFQARLFQGVTNIQERLLTYGVGVLK